jgi:hypothetical protein
MTKRDEITGYNRLVELFPDMNLFWDSQGSICFRYTEGRDSYTWLLDDLSSLEGLEKLVKQGEEYVKEFGPIPVSDQKNLLIGRTRS